MRWENFSAAAPDLASLALVEFDRAGMMLVATVRRDGTPRLSSVQPCVLAGELCLAMLWRSKKALDLLRDPRILLRNPVCTNSGTEVEISLRGLAIEIANRDVRSSFVDAVADVTTWNEPFHLFRVDLSSAALVRYGEGRQTVMLWPQGTRVTRSYG